MSTASNPLDSIREIVLSLFPWLLKLGVWTYRVERVNADGTIDLAPTSPVPPRLPAVPQWLAGTEVTPAVGSLVGVVYLDAPVPGAKPIPAIVAFAPLRASVPASIAIGSTSAPAAARKGDVSVWLIFDAGAGTLYYSTTSATGPWSPVATNPSTPTPPAPGTPGTPIPIATGSSVVTIA